MRVDASRAARRYIERRGGNVYVWFGEAGPGVLQHVRLQEPRDVVFERHDCDGIAVYLQAELAPPETLVIRRLLWLLGPLDVQGTGAGAHAGGAVGGYLGDWPSGGGHNGGGGGHHGGGHGH